MVIQGYVQYSTQRTVFPLINVAFESFYWTFAIALRVLEINRLVNIREPGHLFTIYMRTIFKYMQNDSKVL